MLAMDTRLAGGLLRRAFMSKGRQATRARLEKLSVLFLLELNPSPSSTYRQYDDGRIDTGY
jgi:hypothetical protein